MSSGPDPRLDSLLNTEPTDALWSPDELAAILRHQLAAAVRPDLALAGQYPPERIDALCAGAAPPIVTFADLFAHAAPPVELLRAVKGFAKSRRHHPDSPLPLPIADLLYLLAVLLARRSGASISRLDVPALQAATAWALAQPWLPADMQAIVRAAPDAA